MTTNTQRRLLITLVVSVLALSLTPVPAVAGAPPGWPPSAPVVAVPGGVVETDHDSPIAALFDRLSAAIRGWFTAGASTDAAPGSGRSSGESGAAPLAATPARSTDSDQARRVTHTDPAAEAGLIGWEDDPADASPAGPAAPAAGTSLAPSGVAADVQTAVAADGTVPVIIRLREQADVDEVAREAAQAGRAAVADLARQAHGARNVGVDLWRVERAARGAVVADSLQAVADASQAPIQALLETHAAAGRVSDVRQFWIFNGFAATVDATALAALADHPAVASITLDDTFRLPEPIPADADEPALPGWALESVRAPRVWGEYGVRGAGVVVGIMDSGVDGGHPALADSWRGRTGDPAASWFVPTGENYPTPGDGHGHGTHVAGSIVGAAPGEVTGVAPEAEWIAAKIFTDFGATSDSIIHAAFEWMLAPGGDPSVAPDVVNNSWGSDLTLRTEFWQDVAAWEAAGIVPVFANGNSGPGTGTVGSPASYPHAIGVGAVDADDQIAWFSSRGPVTWDGVEYTKPDLAAPGHYIRSTWPRHLSDDGYHTISGTSMAAPHVTGVVALMLSAAPGMTVAEVRDALVGTVRSSSHLRALPNAYGAGIVDAYAAVTRVAHSGLVTGTVTDQDGRPVAARISAGDHHTTSDPATGAYRLWLPAGHHPLWVEEYGYQPFQREVAVITGGTTTVDVVLPSADPHTVSGTVVGPAGPVAGARVTVAGTPVPPVRTGPDGEFTLTVAAGTHRLWVTAGGHVPANLEITVAGTAALTVTLEAAAGAEGWAQYQNHPARTGVSRDHLAPETLQVEWTTAVGGQVYFASPVIADGRVFLPVDTGHLVALDLATGAELWRFTGSTGMRGAPAVAGDTVYVGGGIDGGIYALDAATGELRWHVPTPGQRAIYTQPVVDDGVVYANTGYSSETSDRLYAIDAATGDVQWSVALGPRVFAGPAVADGLVVIGAAGERRLRALDAATGAEVWSLTRPGDEFFGSPSIADGTVYLTTSVPPQGLAPGSQGSLLAVDAATGTLRWEVPLHGDGQGTAPAVYGELVIAGSHAPGTVAAYHRDTGEPIWHYGLPVSGGVSTSVMVTGDGYVVAGSQLDRRLFIVDAVTGELVWEHHTGDNVLSTPAFAEGRLVTATAGGTIRVFHPTGQIAGQVTGPDGPLSATVRVVETGQTTTTDETGAYLLAGLLPGTYTVEASRFGYTTQSEPVTVAAAQTHQLDFTLTPVGNGTLRGTITTAAGGEPVAGATVTLPGTPLAAAVTDQAGDFSFPDVPAGVYELVVQAPGYVPVTDQVTVGEGETTVVAYPLERYDVAVVSDHEGRVTALLTEAGWRVHRTTFAQIDGATGHYQAIVLVGDNTDRADADLERFARIVADADRTGTSLVVLGTGGPSYGSVRTLSRVTGDPATEAAELSQRGEVWLEDVVDHPITAGLPDLDRIPVLASGSWHAWFDGYSGWTLAVLGNDRDGRLGGGVGYQRRTLNSNYILLPAAAPSPWSTWQPAMRELLLAAVHYAATAAYGQVAGQVTDPDGQPLAAHVTVVDGLERADADGDGEFTLLLPPGEHTLRVSHLGFQTVDVPVTVTAGRVQPVEITLPVSPLGTITGQVTEDGSGVPVAGVRVTVADTDLPVATTGPDGRYVIKDVPGGVYQLDLTADGYEPLVITQVTVTNGEVTTVDAALTRAPAVVVIGDYQDQITNFLAAHSIPAEQAGWEVVDALDGVEVVILHNPPDPGREEFLAALAAFDAAGVSVIFPADGWSTRTRGVDMLVRYTGSPTGYQRLGGFNGPEILLSDRADHPLFEGVTTDPVRLLTGSSEAAAFPDYLGIPLASVGEAGSDPAGIGIAYDARSPESVHLLLTGLAATLRNTPTGSWTPDGQRIFLNAVRWAADPGMGGLVGTVTDADGHPIPHAVVEVVDTHWRAQVDDRGGFRIGVPPGEYTVRISAFGYQPQERTVTVGPHQVRDLSTSLTLGTVGAITGVVTSDGGSGIGNPGAGVTALPEVEIRLRGTPYTTVTDADGSYVFTRVEPGEYELELEVAGHVRTLAAVEVTAGETTRRDVTLTVSPLVGIIDDSTFSNSRDRGKQFLRDWGYEVVDLEFDSLDQLAEVDLVVANVSDYSLDPGPEALAAFEEAVNRARIPVLWLGQHGRGAIRFLHDYHGDPAVTGEGYNHGAVTATVVSDHPLVAGLPEQFPLIAPNQRYSYFDGFSGTTVATLATENDGELGATIAYRGRTADTVDVLLSTLSITTWGAPSTREVPALHWTPEAERVLVNALAWALQAQGIGAHVLGTVDSSTGGRIASQVEVVETGRVYQGRAGDGSFLVPLAPGSWTLRVTAFGHEPVEVPVTVAAGEARTEAITLTAEASGTVAGTVIGPDGEPVAEAQVQVQETPLSATTDADGRFTITAVPTGDWTVRVAADGFRTERRAVTVTTGQTTELTVTLRESVAIAVVDTTGSSTFGQSLSALLSAEGYQVELVSRAELATLVDRVDDYRLLIFNASLLSNQRDAFAAVVDAAAAAGVSTIHTSQWGGGYPINLLSELRGDPADTDWGYVQIGIDYLPTVDHPIFAGFPAGTPIPLITSDLSNLNQQYGTFSGYGGHTIATTVARADGTDLGGGIGYRFTSPRSVELLLGSLSAGGNGHPDARWTPQARQLYLNAVAWAIEARQAQLTGVVTGGGQPLAGATVSVPELEESTLTGPDGRYHLGLAEGTYTVRVEAFGFTPVTQVVEMPAAGTVELDVDLAPIPRGEITGTVTTTDGAPVTVAPATGQGPMAWTATTDAAGVYRAEELLPGEYRVTATAAGYLPAEGTVPLPTGGTAELDLTLRPTDVGVLGDVDGALTAYLLAQDLPAVALTWDPELDLSGFSVVVVNGGSPDRATFEAVLAAADEAEVSLVFTGTWAVDRGGIRLLERYTDRVTVGTQGYGDGPVALTGFDPTHPVFAGLPGDPTTLIVAGGYYSVLESYAGVPLAELHVSRTDADPVTGLAVGYDWRTAGSVELLLSASAVTAEVGPGRGWTEAAGQLLVDAIRWAGSVELTAPGAPTLVVDAPVTVEETVTVSGTADWPSQVTVWRDNIALATVDTAADGTWSAQVPLAVGANRLVARAANPAGESPDSAPVTVTRWQPDWQVNGAGPVRPVFLRLDGIPPLRAPADTAELVLLDADGNEVAREELRWLGVFYLHLLPVPRGAEYTLRAELVVDGHLVVIEGPTVRG